MTIILCLDNVISGLDFNPSGTLIATIDRSGVCLISDVNTDDYSSHFKMGGREGNLLNFILLIIATYLFSTQANNICLSYNIFYYYCLICINLDWL